MFLIIILASDSKGCCYQIRSETVEKFVRLVLVIFWEEYLFLELNFNVFSETDDFTLRIPDEI